MDGLSVLNLMNAMTEGVLGQIGCNRIGAPPNRSLHACVVAFCRY